MSDLLRPLLGWTVAALLLTACGDPTRTDDGFWAINGTKEGVFAQMNSITSCSLRSSSAFGNIGPHVSFDLYFEEHPEVGFLFFQVEPLPDPLRGERSLAVGVLGFFAHVKEESNGLGFYQDVVGRAETSIGKEVGRPGGGQPLREVFVHQLVLPEQMMGTPDRRTFTLAGRLSDVQMYCEDIR